MQLYIIIVCLLLCGAPAGAQSGSQRNVPAQAWQELTNGKSFDYKDKKELLYQPPKQNTGWQKFWQNVFEFFSGPAGKIILWGVFFVILGLVLYQLIGGKLSLFAKQAKVQDDNAATDTPEDLLETNWELMLQKAVKSNDLRLAVRYSYMWLLQLLQQKELIQYRGDKTNYEYLGELTDTPYKQSFRSMTRQYEYAWYGQYPLTDAGYDSYMQTFATLKQDLRA